MGISYAATPFAGAFLSPYSSDTWVLVAFILFFLLLYFARVHEFLGRVLDNRAAGIRKQLEEARQLREEAQTKLAEWQRKQQEVQAVTAEIVDAAKTEAARAAEEAKKAIEASVAQRIKSAEEQIQMAEADAVRAVRNAAIDAAVSATSDLLKTRIADSDASSIMDRAIGEVGVRVN